MSLCHMSAKNHMCFYLLLNDLLSISKQLGKNEKWNSLLNYSLGSLVGESFNDDTNSVKDGVWG